MNQIPQDVAKVYAAIDTMSGRKFANFLTPGATFVFGSGPAVVGRKAIAEYVDHFFGMIKGIRHDVEEVWEFQPICISRFTVTYSRKSGDSIAVPGVNVWRMEGLLIDDYRIYIDVNALWT